MTFPLTSSLKKESKNEHKSTSILWNYFHRLFFSFSFVSVSLYFVVTCYLILCCHALQSQSTSTAEDLKALKSYCKTLATKDSKALKKSYCKTSAIEDLKVLKSYCKTVELYWKCNMFC